jgi:hypothetical protein
MLNNVVGYWAYLRGGGGGGGGYIWNEVSVSGAYIREGTYIRRFTV